MLRVLGRRMKLLQAVGRVLGGTRKRRPGRRVHGHSVTTNLAVCLARGARTVSFDMLLCIWRPLLGKDRLRTKPVLRLDVFAQLFNKMQLNIDLLDIVRFINIDLLI